MQSLSLISMTRTFSDALNKVPKPTASMLPLRFEKTLGIKDQLSSPCIHSTFFHPQGTGSDASAIRCVNWEGEYVVRFSVLLYLQFIPGVGLGREGWYGAECVWRNKLAPVCAAKLDI